MKLELYRFASNDEDTIGLLLIDGQFACYTMEDEYRNEKKAGDTRIPAGTYDIKFRKVGGFDQRYQQRFPDMHKGMLELQNVPNFKYILLHIGNTDEDTAGCILVGNTANNPKIQNGFVGHSSDAYENIYPKIADVLEAGGEVKIEIIDWDRQPYY